MMAEAMILGYLMHLRNEKGPKFIKIQDGKSIKLGGREVRVSVTKQGLELMTIEVENDKLRQKANREKELLDEITELKAKIETLNKRVEELTRQIEMDESDQKVAENLICTIRRRAKNISALKHLTRSQEVEFVFNHKVVKTKITLERGEINTVDQFLPQIEGFLTW